MQKKDKHTTALHEKKGISPPEITDSKAISKIKSKRKSKPDAQDLVDGIFTGDITALSRAITLVESKNRKHLKNVQRYY